jgi:TPR repeat protein/ribosomal protein L40E
VRCKKCGAKISPEDRFCEKCGTEIFFSCPSCGARLNDNAKFCPKCGIPLAKKITEGNQNDKSAYISHKLNKIIEKMVSKKRIILTSLVVIILFCCFSYLCYLHSSCYMTKCGNDCMANGRYKDAMVLFMKAANNGDSTAMCHIGDIYRNGYGFTVDYKKAADWYKKSVNKGNPNAMKKLGDMYNLGLSVPKDGNKAKNLYKQAAEKGDIAAMAKMGDTADGEGNLAEAMSWYLKASEKGSTDAMYKVSFFYLAGKGVDKDPNKSKKWYKKYVDTCIKYAKNGNVDAINELSRTEPDAWEQKAIYVNGILAKYGDAKAMATMGIIYSSSNREKMQEWFNKAVATNNPEVIFSIADFYGVSATFGDKNALRESLKLAKLADGLGYTPAHNWHPVTLSNFK